MINIQGVSDYPLAGLPLGRIRRRGRPLPVGVVLQGIWLVGALWAAPLQAAELSDFQANQLADVIVASSLGQTTIEYSVHGNTRAEDQEAKPEHKGSAGQPVGTQPAEDPYADDAYADDADADLPVAATGHADPFEPFNRKMFAFNNFLDRWLLRPVAKGYVAVTPDPVRAGINNFLGNLFAPTTIVNDLLQGRPGQAMKDSGRFLINLVVGFGGIFDPATDMGLPEHGEDFGQTLGVWGAKTGPYLMLPLLGPSDFRDSIGRVADYGTSPFQYMADNDTRLAVGVVGAINTRANLLRVERLMQQSFDPYAFLREGYLNSREAAIQR